MKKTDLTYFKFEIKYNCTICIISCNLVIWLFNKTSLGFILTTTVNQLSTIIASMYSFILPLKHQH